MTAAVKRRAVIAGGAASAVAPSAARARSYELELHTKIASYRRDPLGYVLFAFPWGVAGTALADEAGPLPWQRDILERLGQGLISTSEAMRQAVASGHGIGKLQAYNDVVPTPIGMRRWGDLKCGDEVFGGDGRPTPITATTHYRDVPMYRVTFDDRSHLDVSSGHLWNVRGRQERRNGLDTWRTLETIELLRLGVKRANGDAEARQWEIPVQGPAQYASRAVPLHPYLVGVWLGDGSRSSPMYTKPYPEVADKLRGIGYVVTDHADGKSHGIRGVRQHFKVGVFVLGSHERYIPQDYKFNDVASRAALFAGLCDSDGEVHASGSIGYSTTSERLAHDVIWLARSLGCKAMLHPTVKQPAYTGPDGEKIAGRDCYRVTINAPFNPFVIEHKRAAYKPSEARYLKRWIDSIEPIGNADGMCITVAAPDGLYQARDHIVTHNSALVAWVVLWALSTLRDTRGIVTANTESQLRTKTWPELAKWHAMAINRTWFVFTATALYSSKAGHEKTWRCDAITWSENNTEAIAGLHNKGRRAFALFDEASAIPDTIFETVEGALTDANTELFWCIFGNPTRTDGRFRECFAGGRFAHRWSPKQIDSRDVAISNKAQIAEWVIDYGEDSDFVRIRVKGMFPRAGEQQFIDSDRVEKAMQRPTMRDAAAPLIMGVDIGRTNDPSVIRFRQGPDARSIAPVRMNIPDLMQVASRVAEQINAWKPAAVFVDMTGLGAGVVDRLHQLGFDMVMGVNFSDGVDQGAAGSQGILYANMRAKMYGGLKDWCKIGCLPEKDRELQAQITAVRYGYDAANAILLERKQDMKKRGMASPDDADALALTFAHPVAGRDLVSEKSIEDKLASLRRRIL